MMRPRAADDFAAIRAGMEELRRERLQAERDKALGVLESRRYPRSRKPESDPAGKQEIGLFAIPDERGSADRFDGERNGVDHR